MKIIQFGKFDLFIPIFIYFLFLEQYVIKDSRDRGIFKVILISMFYNFGSIICIVFEIIIKCRVNKKNKKNVLQSKQSIHNSLSKKSGINYKLILLFGLVAVFDSSSSFLYFYGKDYELDHSPIFSLDYVNRAIQIFLTCIFCYFILNSKLEKFKICGLFIMLVGYLSNLIITMDSFKDFSYILFLLELSNKCETALKETVEKYLIHSMFQSPYIILFIEGVAGNIILGIALIICVFTQKGDFWVLFSSHFKQYIMVTIICIGHNCCRVLLTMRTSPTHRIMADTFYSFIKHLIKVFLKEPSQKYLEFISEILVCIGALIYNEIIIFKFCGLDIDTSNEINNRAIKEISEVENINGYENDSKVEDDERKTELGLSNLLNEEEE